jgi:hypothetical protein
MKTPLLLEKAEKIIAEKLDFQYVEFIQKREKVGEFRILYVRFQFTYNDYCLAQTAIIRYESVHDARVLLEDLRTKVLQISVADKSKNTDITL